MPKGRLRFSYTHRLSAAFCARVTCPRGWGEAAGYRSKTRRNHIGFGPGTCCSTGVCEISAHRRLSGSLAIRNSDFVAGFRSIFGQTWPQHPSRTTGLILQCRLHQQSGGPGGAPEGPRRGSPGPGGPRRGPLVFRHVQLGFCRC